MAASNCEPTRWLPGFATPAPGCNGVAIPHTHCSGRRSSRVVQVCGVPLRGRLARAHGTAVLPLRRSYKSVRKETRRDRQERRQPANLPTDPRLLQVLRGEAERPDISARAISYALPAGKGSDIPRVKRTAETRAEARDCPGASHAVAGK